MNRRITGFGSMRIYTAMIGRIAIIMCFLLAPPANAQLLLCTAPLKPSCVDVNSTFERDITIERCRQDLEDYLEDVRRYRQCLNKAAETTAAAAEQIKQRFECKSGRSEDCK